MDPHRARELLSERRVQVERQLADVQRRDHDEDSDGFEQSDAAADLLDAELSEGLLERLRDELGAIERAERRLEDGTYGTSIESGAAIPDGRLETIPWAERTAEEQERFERLGGAGSAT
jgi:DnaK suppressor protein